MAKMIRNGNEIRTAIEAGFPFLLKARKQAHNQLCNGLRKASAPRQLLIYRDVMNAENAGAFFCPASPKAPTVGALPPA
jgi:hypothetical protein